MLRLASAALLAGLVLMTAPLGADWTAAAQTFPEPPMPEAAAVPPPSLPQILPPVESPAEPPVPPPAPPRAATSGQSTASLPAPDEGRYNMHRADQDLVRLDTRTGQVSVCRNGAAGWSCQAVPDERAALDNEIGRLQNENAALKKELLARGLSLPNGARTEPPPPSSPPVARAPEPAPPAPPTLKTPSDADLDRMMGFVEKVWRRLVEMMANLQRDLQKKT